jgi:hypothetical protein
MGGPLFDAFYTLAPKIGLGRLLVECPSWQTQYCPGRAIPLEVAGMIDAILQSLIQSRSGERRARLAHEAAPALVRAPDTAAGLANALIAGAHREAVLLLLANCLDHGRMAHENAQTGGAAFLDQMAFRLAGAARQGALDAETLVGIASCYARAGLETPAALLVPMPRSHPGVAATARGQRNAKPGNVDADAALDAAIDRVVVDAGDAPLQLHSILADMLAALPPPVRGLAVHRLAQRGTPVFDKLACYWLLDASAETRRAVAQAMTDRKRQAPLPPALVADIQRLLSWLPDAREREVLAGIAAPATNTPAAVGDIAVQDARAKDKRKNGQQGRRAGVTAAWHVETALISMPDGAGAQNLTLMANRGRERAVALCLLKRNHGVKDAFVIPCKGKTEQQRIVDEIAHEVTLVPILPQFALKLLEHALADGIAAGALPAPGLLDVADLIGTPVPTAMEASTLLASLGPATQVLLTSKAKIAKLAGRESAPFWNEPIFDSWFEQTEALDRQLAAAATRKRAMDLVWDALAERRQWWAGQLAISAAIADASPALTPFASASMAAAAHGLLGSGPIMSLGVMQAVAEATLEAFAGREQEIPGQIGSSWSPPATISGIDEGLAAAGLSVPFLDGWGTALAAAPVPPSPAQALSGILERLVGVSVGSIEALFVQINDGLMEAMDIAANPAALAERLRGLSPTDCMAWCAGFDAMVMKTKRNWPRTRLGANGRELLELMALGTKATLDLPNRARAAQLVSALVARGA